MLELESISKTYGNGVKALDNISLSVPKGMFGLLGPNGAGKSSLMRTIATLQKPDQGNIRFGKIDVIKRPQALRRVLGYLPQEFGVYPGVSAQKLLSHFAVMKGVTDKKERIYWVDYLLDKTNLLDQSNMAVSTFSGGMLRRFGIAVALIANPKLIIVDEPTAGLDLAERYAFNTVLSDISEDSVVLLSTHLVEDISDLCQQVAIIMNGKLVTQGEPSSLVSLLANKLWQREVDNNLENEQSSLQPISTRLAAGKRVQTVVSETQPGNDFLPLSPTLGDYYFYALSQSSQETVNNTLA